MHTQTHARTHAQITLLSVDSYAQHVYNVLIVLSNIYNLTITNSQFSSFLERARSKLLGSLKQKCSWHA